MSIKFAALLNPSGNRTLIKHLKLQLNGIHRRSTRRLLQLCQALRNKDLTRQQRHIFHRVNSWVE